MAAEYLYEQKTGKLFKLVTVGYSGHDDGDGIRESGEGKNDPAEEYVANVGPLPHGWWTFGPAFTHPSKGPVVHQLIPDPATDTHGRDHFLNHGDSIPHPGSASEGCLITPRPVREMVQDKDRLHVVNEIVEMVARS